MVTGSVGGIDCVTVPNVCDIDPRVVPLKAAANTWLGANDFSAAPFFRLAVASGLPTTGCATAVDVGKAYVRSDAKAAHQSFYVCVQTGDGVWGWETP